MQKSDLIIYTELTVLIINEFDLAEKPDLFLSIRQHLKPFISRSFSEG